MKMMNTKILIKYLKLILKRMMKTKRKRKFKNNCKDQKLRHLINLLKFLLKIKLICPLIHLVNKNWLISKNIIQITTMKFVKKVEIELYIFVYYYLNNIIFFISQYLLNSLHICQILYKY